MIMNPLDFKINRDLIFLRLGISHTPLVRSTAYLNIGIQFIGLLESDLEQDYDPEIFKEEIQSV